MRAATILSTLALATAVIAAPAPRPIDNGDISNSNPIDPEGDLAARGSVTVSVDPKEMEADAMDSFAQLQKLGHGASAKVPAKVNVTPRQAGLPTTEVTDLVDEVTGALPVDVTKEVPVPIRRRQLSSLPTTEMTGIVGKVTDAPPIDTTRIVTEDLPLPIRRRQLSGLPTTEVTGVVDEVTNAIPTQNLKDVLPVDVDSVTKGLPIPVRRGELGSLLSPLTSTLDLLVSKFSTITQGLSSASTKLNAMLPANINNGDAVLSEIMSTLTTIQPEMNDAIDTLQKGNVQGLISTATDAESSKTVTQLSQLIGTSNKMLTQMSQDADAITGLGVTSDVSKIQSIQTTVTGLLTQLKTASSLPVPF